MKINIIFIYLVACLCMRVNAAETQPAKDEFILGLSPFQAPVEREQQQAMLEQFLLSGCPNSSHVVAWDAWQLRVIFDLQLPALTYDSASARAVQVAPAVRLLLKWYAERDKNQSPTGLLTNSNAIKIPQWLQVVTGEHGDKTLIILASQFCFVPDEPSFSMTESRYPSDGHLAQPSANSNYGIADKHGRCTGTTVFWAYPSTGEWASEHYRECVTRWWALYVAGQGGVLAGFCCDTPEILRNAARRNRQPVGVYTVNPNDSMVTMHMALPRETPVEMQQVQLATSPSTPPPVLKPSPPPGISMAVPPDPGPLQELQKGKLRQPVRITLENHVIFNSGSANLSIEGEVILKQIGQAAIEQQLSIEIRGYTDDVPITGSLIRRFKDNQTLSEARAQAAASFLTDIVGVLPSVIHAQGYGEADPVAPNDSDENRGRNRRIELVLTPAAASPPMVSVSSRK